MLQALTGVAAKSQDAQPPPALEGKGKAQLIRSRVEILIGIPGANALLAMRLPLLGTIRVGGRDPAGLWHKINKNFKACSLTRQSAMIFL